MVGLTNTPISSAVGSGPPSEAVSVFVWEQRLITNLYIDDFNLYYRALKDTLPRLGSTTRADWLRLPFPSPGRAPLRDSTDADWNPHRPTRSSGLGSASSDPVSTPT